jgi:hypothetical protein
VSGGQLWYVTYNSSSQTWSTPVQVPGVSMVESPSAAVFNNDLYVFYQGTAVASQICYCLFNGSSWEAPVAPPIGGMTGSPSAVTFMPPGSSGAQLYVFYEGGGSGPSGGPGPFYNVFNGSSWTTNAQLPGDPWMSGSPSATALIDQLCVAFQGYGGGSGDLYYMIFNGSTWSGATPAPGVSMTGSPAAAALNNYSWWIIYGNESGQLSYVVCSGQNNWNAQVQVVPPNYTSGDAIFSYTPAPVVFNSQLYVFCNSAYGGGQPYYCSSSNASSWSDYVEVPGTDMSSSPSPVVFNNQVYLFHEGGKQCGQIWCNRMSTSGSWAGDTQIMVTNSGSAESVGMTGVQSPSAVVFNGSIYCFYPQNGSIYYVILNGSSWNVNSNVISPGGTLSGEYMSQTPAAIVYDDQIFVFFQVSSNLGNYQLLYVTSSDGQNWSSLNQAGSSQPAAGGNPLAVAKNLVQQVVGPLIQEYLVPDDLLDTAIPKPKAGGGFEWVSGLFDVIAV